VPAPPAVTNAIHAACGRRLTTLPADFLRLFEAAPLPAEEATT
jgi:CO/xanthine dehydrogenase Mo-binding subunit